MAKCAACNEQLPNPFITTKDEKKVCNPKCLEMFYLKKMAAKEENLAAWRNAWHEYRIKYGELANELLTPERYKRNYGKFCTGKKRISE